MARIVPLETITIFDGYVDEPSCLGVPPLLSPYPRLLAGAIKAAGRMYRYVTVDQWRLQPSLLDEGDLLIASGGAIVPGKYLRGMPASTRELGHLAAQFPGRTMLGGPLVRFSGGVGPLGEAYDDLARLDLEAAVFDLLTSGKFSDRERTPEEEHRWLLLGAELVRHHPDFPDPLLVELEVYRGCVRWPSGGCTFCIEPLYGAVRFRTPELMAEEAAALARAGARNFRLGGMSCIFSYMAERVGEDECPRPRPEQIERLVRGIRTATDAKVLHLDNADPAVVAEHPQEAREAAKALVEHCTSGNTLSFGLETADPEVYRLNNLNATAEQCMEAIALINEVGSARGPTGLPHLLPGLNFIAGLEGETKETFALNRAFLQEVLDRGYLLRRINLRQLLETRQRSTAGRRHHEFVQFKQWVRAQIDRAMLRRIAPEGTILHDVFFEYAEGHTTFGRQIGTYPLLVGVSYPIPLNRFLDIYVTAHGSRSLTGVEHPFPLNRASLSALQALPGIGAKRAARLHRGRPYRDLAGVEAVLDEPAAARALAPLVSFN